VLYVLSFWHLWLYHWELLPFARLVLSARRDRSQFSALNMHTLAAKPAAL